jgi:Rrf2 family transcriptional regulator, nitric oxide-sensitive transcriptional repressor
MRLALHTDYGLRVLMFLTGKSARTTISQIAEFFGISKDHVAKVVQRLARLGYLRSQRGMKGGLQLARDPQGIPIGQVIRDLEGQTGLLDCVHAETNICVIQPGCRLRGVLRRAEEIQLAYLDSITLQDVVSEEMALVALQ